MIRPRLVSLVAFLCSLLVFAAPRSALADPVVLRIASLAPEGSAWMKLFHEWQKAVEARTSGRVKVKFYPGGSQGDERDMLRKIKLNQISGAAVTAIGLSLIDNDVRTMEVARTYEELDGLRAHLDKMLRKRFEERGYVLLGWGDVGPVHLFTKEKVSSLAELRNQKIWLWSDDPISKKLFKALGLNGVPMGVPDVLPALSTGSVNAFFGSPLSTLALQWNTHVKYMHTMVVSQATGATVLSRTAFEQLTPEDRAVILDEALKMEAHVLRQVRDDNVRALSAMKKRGLEELPTSPKFEKELRDIGEQVVLDEGKSLSPEMQALMKKTIEEYGARQKNEGN